jgi:putative sigma-54 modulation protein
MNFKITARHAKINDTISQYLKSKIDILFKHFDRIKSIEVILDHNKKSYCVEIIVSVLPSEKLISKVSDYDYVTAIDSVLKKMDRQLFKAKDKTRKETRKSSTYNNIKKYPIKENT